MIGIRQQQEPVGPRMRLVGPINNEGLSDGAVSRRGYLKGGQMQGFTLPLNSTLARMPGAQAPPNQGQSGTSIPLNQSDMSIPPMLQMTSQEMAASIADRYAPKATDKHVGLIQAQNRVMELRKLRKTDPVAYNQYEAQQAAIQEAIIMRYCATAGLSQDRVTSPKQEASSPTLIQSASQSAAWTKAP